MWNWGPHGTLVKVIREHSQMVPLAENTSLKVGKWKRRFQPYPDLSEGSSFFATETLDCKGSAWVMVGNPRGVLATAQGHRGLGRAFLLVGGEVWFMEGFVSIY